MSTTVILLVSSVVLADFTSLKRGVISSVRVDRLGVVSGYLSSSTTVQWVGFLKSN